MVRYLSVNSSSRNKTASPDTNTFQFNLPNVIDNCQGYRLDTIDIYNSQYLIETGRNDTFAITVVSAAGSASADYDGYTFTVTLPPGYWTDPDLDSDAGSPVGAVCTFITAEFLAGNVASSGTWDAVATVAATLTLTWERTLSGRVNIHVKLDNSKLTTMTYQVVDTPLARALGFTASDFATIISASTTAFTALDVATSSSWNSATGSYATAAALGLYAQNAAALGQAENIYICCPELAVNGYYISDRDTTLPSHVVAKVPVNVAPGARIVADFTDQPIVYYPYSRPLRTFAFTLRNVDGSLYRTHGIEWSATFSIYTAPSIVSRAS